MKLLYTNNNNNNKNNNNSILNNNNITIIKITLTLLLVLSFNINIVRSDIPTHCTKTKHVVGKWEITRTKLKQIPNNDKDNLLKPDLGFLCGHSVPSHEKSSYKANSLDKNAIKDTIIFELKADNTAVITNKNNQNVYTDKNNAVINWTMVYDEGFDVISGIGTNNEVSYFTFLKYLQNDRSNNKITSNWASYCHQTLNGWYHEGNEWGCFNGHRMIDNYDKPTNGEAPNKQNITEDSIDTSKQGNSNKDNSSSDNFESSSFNIDRSLYDGYSNTNNNSNNNYSNNNNNSIFDSKINVDLDSNLFSNNVSSSDNFSDSYNPNKYNYKSIQIVDHNRDNTVFSDNNTSNSNNINNNSYFNASTNLDFLNFKFTQTTLGSKSKSKSKSKSNSKCKSKFTEKLTLHANFKEHHKFVERVNSVATTWKAKVYKEFENMTLKELNHFAGKKKSRDLNNGENMFLFGNVNSYKAVNNNSNNNSNNKTRKNLKKKRMSANTRLTSVFNNYSKQNNNTNNTNNANKSMSLLKKINGNNNNSVKKFNTNYTQYMGKARSQGSCGSCFAASTLTMIEARLKKIYKEKIPSDYSISLDHILECSVYNQGCDGGYSYLVLKFGHEIDFLSKTCYNSNNKCVNQCKGNKNNNNNNKIENKPIKIKDYYYVGGSYGKCTEDLMIKELNENGPFVISFEPAADFMSYSSGIFQSTSMSGVVYADSWTKVDHSVVLVDYGEEIKNGKKVKYWLCLNSWGDTWGETYENKGGYFRVLRGNNHMGIESICEAGNPKIEGI